MNSMLLLILLSSSVAQAHVSRAAEPDIPALIIGVGSPMPAVDGVTTSPSPPTLFVYPHDVLADSVRCTPAADDASLRSFILPGVTDKWIVRWQYSEAALPKVMAIREAQLIQPVCIAVGTFSKIRPQSDPVGLPRLFGSPSGDTGRVVQSNEIIVGLSPEDALNIALLLTER